MTNDAIGLLLEAARREEREACAKVADDLAKDYEGRAELPHAKNTPLWGQRMTQACVASEVAELIRARSKDGAQ